MKPTSVEKTRAIANISTPRELEDEEDVVVHRDGQVDRDERRERDDAEQRALLEHLLLEHLADAAQRLLEVLDEELDLRPSRSPARSISPRSERSITSQASVFSANGEHVSLNRLPAPWPSPLPCEEAASEPDEDEEDPDRVRVLRVRILGRSRPPPWSSAATAARRASSTRRRRTMAATELSKGSILRRVRARASSRLHAADVISLSSPPPPREPPMRAQHSGVALSPRSSSAPRASMFEYESIVYRRIRSSVPSCVSSAILLAQPRWRRIPSGIPEAARPILEHCFSVVYAQGFRRV